MVAPTRSGKGVGVVVPTLLSWTGSAIIHDIKGENWQATAGWRSRFSIACISIHGCEISPLQSACGGQARSKRGARCAKHR